MFRDDFPILDQTVNGHPLIYLDNAATTQTPKAVYRVYQEFYENYNANVHRGIHELSHEASVAYEEAHDRLADFVGATGGRKEMVFTKNTTESINLIANGMRNELGPEDVIVTTEMEHHASLVTWQQLAERTGADIRYIRVTDDGHLDMEHAEEVITPDTALVSVVHVSNVLGTINPVADLADLAHENDAKILVDGAQSVPNRPVDVTSMDADFLAFSGHKMAGPTGIGGLYGKEHLLDELDPFLFGGEMIRHVTFEESSWNELPWKFEAGTPPIAEAIGLAAAADYLDAIGMDQIREHENELAQYALNRLGELDWVETYGPDAGEPRTGLVSFNVDGVHGHDVSSILNDRGIAVRAGDHCTQPLHDVLDIPGSVRISFYIYNSKKEIDEVIGALENAPEALEPYLASDRYADAIYDHYRSGDADSGIPDPTVRKHSEETTCGDEGEFQLRIEDGTIVEVGFRSRSCAVSQAVASILTTRLEGMSVAEVAGMDGFVGELLDGQFPELRRDCVVGPEAVIREAATEYLETHAPGESEVAETAATRE